MTVPVVFSDPDSPHAVASLAGLLQSLANNAPVLGLVVKVKDDGGQEVVTNWMFADVTLLKSLALVMPAAESTASKE